MSLEFELYEEKRRKIRRSSFLKGSLVTLLVVAISLFFWNKSIVSYPHIAMYQVFGEIYDDPERDQVLAEMAMDDDVYGVIVQINSPGGTVVGAEALYESLQNIRRNKPVIISIGEVGASAAYIAALAGDKIYARGNSLVGSIGVVVQYPDLSELAEFLGVSMQVIKSGEAKAANFLEPLNDTLIKNQELLVNDSFTWFKELVSERRDLQGLELERVSKGQLFTGRMALDLGLIDSIGSLDDALEYFQKIGSEFKDINVISWSQKQKSSPIWEMFLGLNNFGVVRNKIKLIQSPVLLSIVG